MVVLLTNAFNILMTIHHRVEPKLYASLWFIIATVVLFPLVYFIGNVMWAPPTGALMGINDATINWFYGHNVLGLWFTTGLLAVIYYIVPKETGTPLYSLSLSLIAFWGTLFFYTGVGAHHLLWAPIPYWLKTIAVAESIGMVIPVLATMFNILLTMRGNWSHVRSSVPLLYVLTGWAAYILVSFQGSNEALRGVNELTHFTQYVPGHAHARPALLLRLALHRRGLLRPAESPRLLALQPQAGAGPVRALRDRFRGLLPELRGERRDTGRRPGSTAACPSGPCSRPCARGARSASWAAPSS